MNTIYVAEIGINHSGNLQNAFALIDLAKKHGFDYVKFQKRDIEMCYTKDYLDGKRDSPWGTTQREQKMGLEFSIDQYELIDAYCKRVGINWFYSPWDVKSAVTMNRFDCHYVKMAKASLSNKALVDCCVASGKKLIVSTNYYEFKNDTYIIGAMGDNNRISHILSCVSLYPSPEDFNGLHEIHALKKMYNHYTARIGYSNHSPNWIHPVIASYMDISMIEVHITLDKKSYGSDQAASLDDSDLSNMMRYRCKHLETNAIIDYMAKEDDVLKKLRQTW